MLTAQKTRDASCKRVVCAKDFAENSFSSSFGRISPPPPTLTVQPPLGVFHAPHTAARTPVFMMQLEVLRRSPVVRGEPGDASVDRFGHGCVAAAVIQFDAGCAENRG